MYNLTIIYYSNNLSLLLKFVVHGADASVIERVCFRDPRSLEL